METNICKHCKKIFKSKFRVYTCKECQEKDDLLFDNVILYLNKYPNSSAVQIAEGLEVDVYEITKYIDEGRLYISKGVFGKL